MADGLLKAWAVYGNTRYLLCNPQRFMPVCAELLKLIVTSNMFLIYFLNRQYIEEMLHTTKTLSGALVLNNDEINLQIAH